MQIPTKTSNAHSIDHVQKMATLLRDASVPVRGRSVTPIVVYIPSARLRSSYFAKTANQAVPQHKKQGITHLLSAAGPLNSARFFVPRFRNFHTQIKKVILETAGIKEIACAFDKHCSATYLSKKL